MEKSKLFYKNKKSHGNKICEKLHICNIQENSMETKFRKKVKIQSKICLNKVEKISKFHQKSVKKRYYQKNF